LDSKQLLSPKEIAPISDKCGQVLESLQRVIIGKPDLLHITLATVMSGGHVLLEGLPGLGKTVLSKSLSHVLGISFGRIQFTPDLLPSDITGSHMLEETESGHRALRFYPGPVFNNLVLADEINRASPKTQSALLEAMSEYQVTLMGERMVLERPFSVLATQNPIEMEGTYPLPEAQLDRFAVKLNVPGTTESDMETIIKSQNVTGTPRIPENVVETNWLAQTQQFLEQIFLPEPIIQHISRIVAATHPENDNSPSAIREWVKYGSSPRGGIWLVRVARALAIMDGRPGVGFKDIAQAAPYVLGHRILLNHTARLEGINSRDLATEITETSEQRTMQG
jgi:MoxR-like ATPase